MDRSGREGGQTRNAQIAPGQCPVCERRCRETGRGEADARSRPPAIGPGQRCCPRRRETGRTPVVLLITQRLRRAARLDVRRIRAEIASHDGNDAGQQTVEMSRGKEKLYHDRAMDTAPEWSFCACRVAGSTVSSIDAYSAGMDCLFGRRTFRSSQRVIPQLSAQGGWTGWLATRVVRRWPVFGVQVGARSEA
jgi:hypothetical protein